MQNWVTICHACIVVLGLRAVLVLSCACRFVRKCKVSVIVSDVSAQASSYSPLPFHLAVLINSVYMMKLKQEHICKFSVVWDKKQCHLIRLLSKHMFSVWYPFASEYAGAQCVGWKFCIWWFMEVWDSILQDYALCPCLTWCNVKGGPRRGEPLHTGTTSIVM